MLDRNIGNGFGGCKIHVQAYEHDKRVTLTTFKKVDYGGGCSHESCSLSPAQALVVAGLLGAPVIKKLVKMEQGKPKLLQHWTVLPVRHGNGVHDCDIGIKGNTVGWYADTSAATKSRKRVTNYWWNDRVRVTLTEKELTLLRGALYYWVGARMLGFRTEVTTKKRELLYVCEPSEDE